MNMKRIFWVVILLCTHTVAYSQATIILQPDASSGKDARIWTLEPDANFGDFPYYKANAWTWNGSFGIERGLFEFDLSAIPDSSEILEAKLSLYYPWIEGSPNQTHSSLSGPNIALIQRVVEDWVEDEVTWNNQPGIETHNQVTLHESTSPTQDYTDINVKDMVQDMVDNPLSNFGFLFRLETEINYRRMSFASSDRTVDSLRPKLVITYLTCSIDLGNDTTICNGDELELTPGPNFVDYLWQDGSSDSIFVADAAGIYWVETIDVEDCLARDSVHIAVESLDVFIGNDTLICSNDLLILNAGNGFETYFWNTSATEPMIIAESDGQYWVEVTNELGCFGSDTILITYRPTPEIVVPPAVSICDGEPAVLDAGEGFISYLWSTGDTVQSITVTDPGSYSIIIENEYGCIADATIEVDVSALPEMYLPDEYGFCPGTSDYLDAGNIYTSYLWSTGDTTKTINVSSPGEYWLKVTNAGGCENSDSTEVFQFLQPEFLSLETTATGTLIIEGSGGTPPYGFALNGGDFQNSNEFKGLLPGNYQLFIHDMNGCQNDTVAIVPEVPLIIPNFFTPNGDNIHDRWEIEGIQQYPEAMITIFDRYGKLLVSYYGNETGWDGNYNGQAVGSDTYWYQITFQDGQPTIAGDVTIKR